MSRRGEAKEAPPTPIRCAIYTRNSSGEGLDQEFNSLDAQRESAEAFIASQRAEAWDVNPERCDDGGFSGGTMERPALARPPRSFREFAARAAAMGAFGEMSEVSRG